MPRLRRITAVNALFYVGLGCATPFIGLYLERLGATYAQISLILTFWIGTTIVANTLYARYSLRLGSRRAWLAAGLGIQALGYGLLAVAARLPEGAPVLGWAAGARMIEAVGGAIWATVSLAIVGEILKGSPAMGRTMGMYRGIGSVAFAAGALLGGWLANRFALEATLVAGMVFYAAAGSLALMLPRGPRPRPRIQSPVEAAADARAAALPARSTLPWRFLAGVVLVMAAISASSSMAPLYLDSLGRSRLAIGGLWSLTAALELPAMWLTGMLSDSVGRAPLLALGGAAIALVQVLYAGAARWGWMVLAAQVTRALGYASYTANSMTYTAELSTESDRSANSGVYNVAQYIGQLAGLLLGGTLAQALGFAPLFGLCAALSMGGALAFLSLRRGRTQAGPD